MHAWYCNNAIVIIIIYPLRMRRGKVIRVSVFLSVVVVTIKITRSCHLGT